MKQVCTAITQMIPPYSVYLPDYAVPENFKSYVNDFEVTFEKRIMAGAEILQKKI